MAIRNGEMGMPVSEYPCCSAQIANLNPGGFVKSGFHQRIAKKKTVRREKYLVTVS